MESDGILSFSAPLPSPPAVVVRPAPVLELVYAHYHVTHRLHDGRATLPWLRALRESHPAWLDRLIALWNESEGEAGHELFLMACAGGYALDPDPDRFLGDLPGLATRVLDQLEKVQPPRAADDPASIEEQERARAQIGQDLERMARPPLSTELPPLLRELWSTLRPAWEREGEAAAQAAADAFEAALEGGADLLEALPRHHFAQFEAHAEELRRHRRSGALVVTPLTLASTGGFNVGVGDTLYLGYGLHGETVFEEDAARLAELASRIKAFADPTRLQLLGLIARFGSMPLTVGDLARQLGVSQPTVSGHLKVLREAGVVHLERRGNRAYHRVDEQAVHALLDGLKATLLG